MGSYLAAPAPASAESSPCSSAQENLGATVTVGEQAGGNTQPAPGTETLSPAALWERVCTCPRDPALSPSASPGVRLLEHILGPADSRSDAADIEARALRSLAVMAPGWARAPPADWTRALRSRAPGSNSEALGLSLALYLHDLGLCRSSKARSPPSC
jgi:hypothetical protein